jgi:hypothetical protein
MFISIAAALLAINYKNTPRYQIVMLVFSTFAFIAIAIHG